MENSKREDNCSVIRAAAKEEDIGKRADVFVSECCGITRSAAAVMIEDGAVSICGEKIRKNYRIRSGDEAEMRIHGAVPCEASPEDIPLDIVYEDDDVIVINKPQGMVVHPAPGHTNGTLVSALLYHCKDSLSDINGVIRPGIVHRIDKDTGGLIAVAKNNDAHLSLAAQLEDHSLSRVYHTVVLGNLNKTGCVDAPIARHKTDRKKMSVATEGGRRAVTHYEAIEYLTGFTYAKMKLETGRTHQIRVHMSHIGHPILGDEVYGRPTQFARRHPGLLHGQCLHAKELSFDHPRTGERITVSCDLPDNFKRVLELLRSGK